MSQPLTGAVGPAAFGETSMEPRSGHSRLACLFATHERAEQARKALMEFGVPSDRIDLTYQDARTEAGDADGGMWESLKRWFTGEEADTYYEGINRGHTLLTVQAQSPDDADRLSAVLEKYDPIDLDAQETGWRSSGWTGRSTMETGGALHAGAAEPVIGAEPMTGTTAPDFAGKPAAPPAATTETALAGRAELPAHEGERLHEGEQRIPLGKEELSVGKREVGRGTVRVRSYVVERPVEEDVHLHEQRVEVERRPVDRPVGGESPFQERTVEMTETREEAVVQKTARVTEEVVVRSEEQDRVEHVSDKVRETKVDVEDERTGKRRPR